MKAFSFSLILLLLTFSSLPAQDQTETGMFEGFRWEGRGNWTINAGAVNASSLKNPRFNQIDLFLPEGSQIEHAFLYSAVFLSSPDDALRDSEHARPDVVLDGVRFHEEDWRRVGVNDSRTKFRTFRADATDALREIIGDLRGPVSLSVQEIDEEDPTEEIHKLTSGEILVVLYSHPGEAERLVILYEGHGTHEDALTVDFGTALDTAIDGFEALMSYGVANSTQAAPDPFRKNALREIDVNGRRLSSMAGGWDDGNKASVRGSRGTSTFITVGGRGDLPTNPPDPYATPEPGPFVDHYDDELYDLAQGNGADATPFLPNGSSNIQLNFKLENPSRKDVPLFLGFNVVTGAAPTNNETQLEEEPPASPTEPDTLASDSYREAYSWVGRGNWSISGVGKGNIQADDAASGHLTMAVPEGATVEKAFVYAALYNQSDIRVAPIIRLGGSFVDPNLFVVLEPKYRLFAGLLENQIFRAEVTNLIRSLAGNGRAQPIEISVDELDFPNGELAPYWIEGVVLVVIYSHPDEDERSLLLIDGASLAKEDEVVTVEASRLVNPGQPGFEALMSVGIAGSVQNAENAPRGSSVDIKVLSDGLPGLHTLTSSAGGSDDGAPQPSRLITIGGFNDSPNNPGGQTLHEGDSRTDDELYDLAQPADANGSPILRLPFSRLQLCIRVGSYDDTLFFIGLNMKTNAPLELGPTQGLTITDL